MQSKWTQAGVLDAMQVGQTQWEDLLAAVGDVRMSAPISARGWSVKDIIAHVTWYEQQMANLLQPHTGPGPPRDRMLDYSADKRNAIVQSAQEGRLLCDVRAEAQQVHTQLVAAVRALTADGLRERQRFPDMPRAWQPWQLIARRSYEHYQEHIPDIRAWLDRLVSASAPTRPRADAAAARHALPAGALPARSRELAASLTRCEEDGGHV